MIPNHLEISQPQRLFRKKKVYTNVLVIMSIISQFILINACSVMFNWPLRLLIICKRERYTIFNPSNPSNLWLLAWFREAKMIISLTFSLLPVKKARNHKPQWDVNSARNPPNHCIVCELVGESSRCRYLMPAALWQREASEDLFFIGF